MLEIIEVIVTESLEIDLNKSCCEVFGPKVLEMGRLLRFAVYGTFLIFCINLQQHKGLILHYGFSAKTWTKLIFLSFIKNRYVKLPDFSD